MHFVWRETWYRHVFGFEHDWGSAQSAQNRLRRAGTLSSVPSDRVRRPQRHLCVWPSKIYTHRVTSPDTADLVWVKTLIQIQPLSSQELLKTQTSAFMCRFVWSSAGLGVRKRLSSYWTFGSTGGAEWRRYQLRGHGERATLQCYLQKVRTISC